MGSQCTDMAMERPWPSAHSLKMLVSIQHFIMYFAELTIEQNNSFIFH